MHRSINKFWRKLRTIEGSWVESYLVSIEGDIVIYEVEFGIGSSNKSSVLYKIDIKDLDNDLDPERIMSKNE